LQYTIRGIPPAVDRALRKKAAQKKQSLNRLIVEELSILTLGERPKADFADLVGKWTPDPAFDEIVASQRKIDPRKWK
jgi:hypothetical protein